MLDPTLLDLDIPVQDNVKSPIGPALANVEDISNSPTCSIHFVDNSMKASNIFSTLL